MSEYGSYIDDSFGAQPWPELQQSAPGSGDALHDYNHPREGHWEVASTIGSYIDDRCPTVHGYPAVSIGEGNVTKLDPGLAQKLARATAAERMAALKASAAKEATKAPSEMGSLRSRPGEAQEVERRPFIIPPHLARNPDVAVEQSKQSDSNDDQLPGAGVAAESALFLPKAWPAQDNKPVLATGKSFHHGGGSGAGLRKIRILGKNGEQAFVELPAPTGVTSKSPQQKASSTHDSKEKFERVVEAFNQATGKTKKEPEKKQGGHRNEEPQKGEKATKQQKKQQKQQQKQPKAESEPAVEHVEEAADFLMSGGLPPPSKASSQANSMASAPKDSVHSKASNAGSAISPRVLSIAQKIASMPPGSNAPSRVPSVREPTPAASQTGWAEVGQGRTEAATVSDHASRHTKVSTNYKPPSAHSVRSSSSIVHGFAGSAFNMFNEQPATSKVGSRLSAFRPPSQTHRAASVAPPSQAARSERSGRGSPAARATPPVIRPPSHASRQNTPVAEPKSSPSIQHSFHVASGFRLSEPTPPASVRGSNRASSVGINDDPRPSSQRSGQGSISAQQQTKFAGTGWISPHPLSVAPTEMASPPQSVVHLPGESFDDPGATLTYEEWRAQRHDAATVASSQPIYVVPSVRSGSNIATSHHGLIIPVYHEQSVHAASQHSQQRSVHPDHAWASNRSASVHASHHSVSHRSAEPYQPSYHSQHRSARDEHVSHTSQRPSVLVQDAGWSFPPQVDGSASDPARTSYSVGITPNELDEYNRRLGNTISHHSAQLSRVQEEQQPPHPDYSSWTGRNSRSPWPSSHHSNGAPKSSSSHRQIHLPIPWDAPAASARPGSDRTLRSMLRTSEHSVAHELAELYNRSPSQRPQSQCSHHSQLSHPDHTIDAAPSKHTSAVSTVRLMSRDSNDSQASVHSSDSLGRHLRQDRTSSLRSNGSEPRAPPAQSEATYGTRNWQKLEEAEQGRGGFQSYRM